MKGSTTLAFTLVQLSAASQLVWPSKWDEVEDLLYMQGGFNKRGLADGKEPAIHPVIPSQY